LEWILLAMFLAGRALRVRGLFLRLLAWQVFMALDFFADAAALANVDLAATAIKNK
jgi:hypothetical protein